MKYTFLLPAYKVIYLAEALQSIKSQTYTDFKVIVSDDCSPEDLKSIFDRTVGDDSRFMYRRNEENLGSESLVSHWNLLVGMCDTEYLIMASDDDIYAPRFLEEVDELIEKYPRTNLFRARVNRIDEKGEVFAEESLTSSYENQVDFLFNLYCNHRLKCIGNYVFKTRVLKEKGMFLDLPLAWGSDDCAVIKMSEDGVCNTSSMLFTFRCAGQNITANESRQIIRKKMKAKRQNLSFCEMYFPTIKDNGSALSKNRLLSFKSYYLAECYEQLEKHSDVLSFREMWDNFRYLIRHGRIPAFLVRLNFLFAWLKARQWM